MADIFGDSPPQDMVRGRRGWLKPKNSGTRKHIVALRQENIELKDRLNALEEMVSSISSKKTKKSE